MPDHTLRPADPACDHAGRVEEQALIEAVESPDDSEHLSEAEERVGPLELFFDLVFVFAIT